ncbi:DUF1259 domain-containing protein [Hyphomicrobium sp.]|uniref:DUF1259 domain-containing protein n=1 Tax=Hyphomicrobium sp. TaxID=82 RepID=UPI002E3039F1|nr:DUF1259 domain-containing protein [Hyphomicrobium sp.]HEX2843203.1 DUF1259 domain-containing protein [Hyphomicrobium sp.]
MRTTPSLAALGCLVLLTSSGSAQSPPLDTAAIEQASGLKGTFSKEENVFKISKPRADVKIAVDGWQMPPFMGLTSWAAFTPAHGGQTMMMGDTVVFEDEINPAMSAALEAGLEVTALHNHFVFDQPRVLFMHIGGVGDAATLAAGVKRVYDKISEIRAAQPEPQTAFSGTKVGATNAITAEPLEAILGTKGQAKDGMFKVVLGRTATMHGTPVGKEMGVNTWAAFAGTDREAVVDGDFAMIESELQPTLKTMRSGGLNIVAIHQHMIHEQPRILFLHYWGTGEAAKLAQSLKTVVDAQTHFAN